MWPYLLRIKSHLLKKSLMESFIFCAVMEVMVADDRNLFLFHKNSDTFFASMNVELENVSTWFKSNKLFLNVHKTKWLLFHSLSKKQLLPQTFPNLAIKNIRIKRVHITKFLGVFIDKYLSWKQHIDIVSSKILRSLRNSCSKFQGNNSVLCFKMW